MGREGFDPITRVTRSIRPGDPALGAYYLLQSRPCVLLGRAKALCCRPCGVCEHSYSRSQPLLKRGALGYTDGEGRLGMRLSAFKVAITVAVVVMLASI